jgi:ABC-2 type transport system ATP-binding protein
VNANGQVPSPVDAAATSAPALAVRDLQKRYGRGDGAVTALDGVSFEVARGSVVGLLGPNGAGKTTALKSALGLLLPDAGEVSVMGVDVAGDPKRAYRHVGAMLEGARNVYWRLTPRENLRFFASLQGLDPHTTERRAYHDHLLETLDLADRAGDSLNDFSQGMKQKVALACTLARETPVVFLDEPTLGLDVEATRNLRERVRALADEEGRTVVLSSHDMDVVQAVCDRVVIMNEGRVVADDEVDSLVGLFRTREYAVTVDGPAETVQRALDRGFEPTAFRETEGRTAFEVTVPDGRFYDLTDALRGAGLEVLSMSAVEPDLEEAFLRLTERGGETPTSAEPAAPTPGPEGER